MKNTTLEPSAEAYKLYTFKLCENLGFTEMNYILGCKTKEEFISWTTVIRANMNANKPDVIPSYEDIKMSIDVDYKPETGYTVKY